MKQRLLVTALAVAAVVVTAVIAQPVGRSALLITEHVLRQADGRSSPSPSSPAGGTTRSPRPAQATPSTSTRRPTTGDIPSGTVIPSPAPSKKGRARPTPSPKPRPTVSPTPEHQQPRRHRPRPKTTPHGVVYLTFDDGPGPATLPILSILDRTGSTATFFQLGANAYGQQWARAAIHAQGSNIGNHSYDHPDLTTLTPAALHAQIANGVPARCFRPPYGATNAAVRRAIHAAGAYEVLWTVDTLDWTRPGVRALKRIGSSPAIHDGSIILMHDGGGDDRSQTIAALPTIVKDIQARGYRVRALPYC